VSSIKSRTTSSLAYLPHFDRSFEVTNYRISGHTPVEVRAGTAEPINPSTNATNAYLTLRVVNTYPYVLCSSSSSTLHLTSIDICVACGWC
jgi:membrane protease subunit (stomatin/prohibitin family)